MLGNREKTVITPPTTRPNKWTQIDDHKVSMASSSGSRVMEKPSQELLQQQQQALRCPRCDSSNTKFCYYNNYSLSQPRHFCKACKRYWTRGGTLRNVPVGGGCRKNKRVKRPTNNIDTTTSTTTTASSPSTPSNNSNPPSQPHIDVNPSAILSHINPLLYGSNNSCDVMNMNLPFPARFNSRYDDLIQQPRLNALGLGFSSGRILASSEVNDDGYRNGFISSSNNNALLSSYNSIFGGSSTSTTSMPSTPVMASLLNSTLLQQKFISGGGGGMKGDPFHGMASRQENSSTEAGMVASKEVKGEGQNYVSVGNCQNQMEHMGLSDPSLYWNNNNNTPTTALGGAWSDQHQPNIGPSVTSLI